MAAKKTWFIPPDFTFLPDGQISLGSVIPGPFSPTVTLACLAEEPSIVLPNVKSLIERNHSSSANKSRSAEIGAFTEILNVAGGKAKVDMSWYKNKSFSSVDHEVRQYNGYFTPQTLKAILALDGVKQHVNRRIGRKRPVYIITGLRVTLNSFAVSEEEGSDAKASLEGSGAAPNTAVPLQVGAGISGQMGDSSKDGYQTAIGIVFAYRLHIIRPKGTGGQAEVFSDPTAFCTGEGDDQKIQEMEIVEVNSDKLLEDLNVDPEAYDVGEGQDESFIVLKNTT